MSSTVENPETATDHWLLCPVCDQPNPAGTLHCHHCWGASLFAVTPLSRDELTETIARFQARARRRNLVKIVGVSILAPLMLFGAVFASIFSFTDVILAPSPTVNSDSPPGQWAMFRHDLSRTGSSNPGATPLAGTLKWTFTTGAEIHSSPTVVDGTVYFGSRDFNLYAVDADTGEKLWAFPTRTWVESSPTVVDGVVYFGSNDGNIYAVDAETGEKLWAFQTRYPVKSSPAVADGMVFIGADDYKVYALDAATGKKIWDFRTDGTVPSSPVVDGGILYIGSMDGHFYALQASNGRFRLSLKAREVTSSPAVKDGIIYFNSRGRVWAVDGQARNWPGELHLRGWWIQFYAFRLAPVPPPISGFLWAKRLGSTSYSSLIITESTIFTTSDNKLFSIDTDTREINWTYETDGNLRSSPALGNNVLYGGTADGRIYAVEAATGEELWSFQTGDLITSSPALIDGVIYVGSHDGKLYAIE